MNCSASFFENPIRFINGFSRIFKMLNNLITYNTVKTFVFIRQTFHVDIRVVSINNLAVLTINEKFDIVYSTYTQN